MSMRYDGSAMQGGVERTNKREGKVVGRLTIVEDTRVARNGIR